MTKVEKFLKLLDGVKRGDKEAAAKAGAMIEKEKALVKNERELKKKTAQSKRGGSSGGS